MNVYCAYASEFGSKYFLNGTVKKLKNTNIKFVFLNFEEN